MPRRRPPQRKRVHREPTYYFVVRMDGEAMGEEVLRREVEFPYTNSDEMWASSTPLEALRVAQALSATPGNTRPYAVYAAIHGQSFISPIGHPYLMGEITGNGFKHRVQWYDPHVERWLDVDTGLSKDEAQDLLDHLREYHDEKFRMTPR